tara:strand:- start:1413 stop:1583 length:171 start_codon:yes stop_codon:yes gene_type:complete
MLFPENMFKRSPHKDCLDHESRDPRFVACDISFAFFGEVFEEGDTVLGFEEELFLL